MFIVILKLYKMKLYKLYIVSISISLICIISSCDKEGPAGPQGPAGAAGQQGPEGPQGPAGSGDSGSIGIISSNWLEVAFVPDTNAIGIYRAKIPDTRLTNNFLLENEVRVYVNLGTNEDPIIASLPNEVGSIYIRHVVVPGNILLTSNLDASTYGDSSQRQNLYKYVLISADAAVKSKNVNMNNYMEVKNAFHLRD